VFHGINEVLGKLQVSGRNEGGERITGIMKGILISWIVLRACHNDENEDRSSIER
jgi:hypothetical protein